MARPARNIDYLFGARFGKLIIIAESARALTTNGKSLRTVKCKCDCGNTKNILLDTFSSKRPTLSCGCINVERSKVENRKHGLKDHILYRKWYGIKTRCYNPKHASYYRYGGRGIKVCSEWLNDFLSFYNWAINNGWSEGLAIDRIDNDGDYEPSNCRFVSPKENNHNRPICRLSFEEAQSIRNTKLLIPEIKNIELAEAFNIHPSSVADILNNRTWNQEEDII